jgi:uncharacterized protein (DUF433 family)
LIPRKECSGVIRAVTNEFAEFDRSKPEEDEWNAGFSRTRVPIQNLFDCIEEGETINQFLDQFPTVTREQVNGILEFSKERLLQSEVAA